MQDLSTLESKSLAELREIGKVLGITDSTLKKKELLNTIIAMATGDGNTPAEEAPSEEAPRKRGRRPRMSSTRIEENKPEQKIARRSRQSLPQSLKIQLRQRQPLPPTHPRSSLSVAVASPRLSRSRRQHKQQQSNLQRRTHLPPRRR